MNSHRRPLFGCLVGLVLLVMLVGDPRGGGSSEPGPASPLELCQGLDRMALARDGLVDHVDGVTINDVKDAARLVISIGAHTEGLPLDARAGLEFFAGLFLALPDSPTTQQLLTAGAPASVSDQAHADALVVWLGKNCS